MIVQCSYVMALFLFRNQYDDSYYSSLNIFIVLLTLKQMLCSFLTVNDGVLDGG